MISAERLPLQGLLLLVLLLPGLALASAGRITFAVGKVDIERNDQTLQARRGFVLESGDTIRTGNGRAQIRFRDGGYMSLQPETVFRIDEYRFSGEADGNERSFFSLLKGGLRAITGLIGHRDHNSYRVRTPTVTIGIRGTGYTVLVDANGNTHASVGEGEIVLKNPHGELRLRSWQSARSRRDDAPRPAPQRPYLPPQPVQVYTPEYQISDERDENGNPVIVTGSRLQSGPGYAIAHVAEPTGQGATLLTSQGGITARFDTNSGLLNYSGSGTNTGADIGTAQLADVGSVNSNLGWGRWTSGTSTIAGSTFREVHYVVALMPTGPLPTTGTAFYGLSGATTPTGNGVQALGGFRAILPTLASNGLVQGAGPNDIIAIDFGNRQILSQFDLVFTNDTVSVDAFASLQGATNPTQSFFANSTGNTCPQGCSGNGQFVLGGNTVDSTGLVYGISTPGGEIHGAFGASRGGSSAGGAPAF